MTTVEHVDTSQSSTSTGGGVIASTRRGMLTLDTADGIAVCLDDGEHLGSGIARATRHHFDDAIHSLESGIDPEAAVAGTDRAIVRVQAILRLVRKEIGAEAYAAEHEALTQIRELLRPVIAGRAPAVTLTTARTRHQAFLRPSVFAALQAELDRRHRTRREAILQDGAVLREAVHLLRRAQARHRAWPIDVDHHGSSRRALQHRFETIRPGLSETYKAGRRAWRTANESRQAADFACWREPVEHLCHQLELLAPLWPDVVGAMTTSAARLAAALNEEFDLAELLLLVASDPELCADRAERSLLFALAQQRRAELHELVANAGTRLYAESPKSFSARMALYWDAWASPGADRPFHSAPALPARS